MYPESTAALDAPTAAFSLSAKSYNSLKFSEFSNPRPPETTTLALPNSGLSDLETSLLTNMVLTSLSIYGISSISTKVSLCIEF